MESLSLSLVNQTFQRKIKPIHNITLLITVGLWLIILPLLSFGSETVYRIAAYLIIFSGFTLLIFFVLSISYLFSNKINNAVLTSNNLVIETNSYDYEHVIFKLNIDQSEWDDQSESYNQKISSLPKWGNYIIINGSTKFEFLPDKNIEKFFTIIKVEGYKERPTLMLKTKDLFSGLMSMLWAAS